MKNRIEAFGLQRALLILIPYLFTVGLFQLIGGFFFEIQPVQSNSTNEIEDQLVISLFGMVGTLLIVWFFAKFLDKVRFSELGFGLNASGKGIFVAFFLGLSAMGLGFLTLLFFDQIELLGVNFDFGKALAVVFIFLAVSVAEETFFRGYILRNLIISLGDNWALALSGLIFMLFHSFNPNINVIGFINLFLAGILLGLPYIFTQNLWFSITLHFSWNLFQSLFGFKVSGQESYSILLLNNKGNNYLIDNGSFGFEGSLFTIFLQSVLILVCYKYFLSVKSVE